MHCLTRIQIGPAANSRDVLPLEIDIAMRVLSAKVDGVPAEVFRRESPREGLVQEFQH